MSMNLLGRFLGAALAIAMIASLGNAGGNDQPSEQGMDFCAYDAGDTVEKDSEVLGEMAYKEGAEIPFAEGQTPPEAPAGYCWCLVTKKATYKTIKAEALVRPETWYNKRIPAKYAERESKVMICPPKKVGIGVPAVTKTKKVKVKVEDEMVCFRIIPAEFEMVEKDIEVMSGGEAVAYIPAKYKTVQEKIMVSPPIKKYTTAKRSGNESEITDECYCVEETPAKFETVEKEVLVEEGKVVKTPNGGIKKKYTVKKVKKPAMIEKITIPAKYKEIDCQEIVEPATIRYETTPAKYKTIVQKCLVEPASFEKVKVSAKYQTLEKTVIDNPEKVVWRLLKKDDCEDVSVDGEMVDK